MIPQPIAPQRLRAVLVLFGLLMVWQSWRAESSPPAGVDGRAVLAERERHLDALGVSRWHQAGLRGAGIRVAILDTGFRNYQQQLGSTLPEAVVARSFRRDRNLEARDSNHGVLCAEVVHAVAPDAELLLANWDPDEPDTFVAAVRWCREQKAHVVSCSVIMPAWSDGEGGGSVHGEISAILGDGRKAGDLIAVACAGNLAARHWGGGFNGDAHGYHRWFKDQVANTVSPWGGDRVSLELTAAPGHRYELDVTDVTDGRAVGERRAHNGSDRSVQIARFEPQTGHSYRLRVRQAQGEGGSFHLAALGAWLEHHVARGSIPFPGDGREWLTVGALDGAGGRAPYSSCGPNSRAPKPELCAPVPFPTMTRALPFSGTSAAAPQAAGIAALIWASHADWRAARVRQALVQSCQDVGATGFDVETGYGRLALPPRPSIQGR